MQPETLLVVDDNTVNLEMLFGRLRHAGFKVLVAEDGQTAIQQARQAVPDLILLDVMMPGIDGFETCQQLKTIAETADIPVIFMTALSETVDKVKGFEAGGVDYITKPFQIEEVLARVRTHLTIRRLQRNLQMQNDLLEQRVKERTAALEHFNVDLQAEVEQRKQSQQEKDHLFDIVRQQNDQLKLLTNVMLDAQQGRQHSATQTLGKKVLPNMELMANHLGQLQALLAEIPTTESKTEIDQHLQACVDIVERVNQHLETATRPPHATAAEADILQLSRREKEVLQYLVDGYSPTEIANMLVISPKTVYTHRMRLMKKLRVSSLTDLIRYTLQHKLVPSE